MATPPNDLDRLASAWRSFQDLTNTRLPSLRSRLWAAWQRVSWTKVGPGPLPK